MVALREEVAKSPYDVSTEDAESPGDCRLMLSSAGAAGHFSKIGAGTPPVLLQ